MCLPNSVKERQQHDTSTKKSGRLIENYYRRNWMCFLKTNEPKRNTRFDDSCHSSKETISHNITIHTVPVSNEGANLGWNEWMRRCRRRKTTPQQLKNAHNNKQSLLFSYTNQHTFIEKNLFYVCFICIHIAKLFDNSLLFFWSISFGFCMNTSMCF